MPVSDILIVGGIVAIVFFALSSMNKETKEEVVIDGEDMCERGEEIDGERWQEATVLGQNTFNKYVWQPIIEIPTRPRIIDMRSPNYRDSYNMSTYQY